ncbi:MAG TPA: universal stress protein, partial [Gillisia sp.]|nr:universal stress protein [Gillisia sp.]
EYSEYALEVASKIAKLLDGELIVVHLLGIDKVYLPDSESVLIYDNELHLKLIKKKFQEFLKKPWLKNVKLTHFIQNYKNFTELNAIAEDFICDLIVMGSHGNTGFKNTFVGSNTENIVRTSRIPVLVIKNRVKDFKIERVVFASDFSRDYLPAFKKLLEWLRPFDAELQLLHVNTSENFMRRTEIEEKIFKFLLQAEIEDISIYDKVAYYDDDSVEEGIFSFSYKYEADIITIPTHGRRGLAHFFIKSLGEDLMNHSEIPILTIKI